MSRPQGVQAGGAAGNRVDASICAHSGTTIERRFELADLPRLRDAGAREGSVLTAVFGFSQLEGKVAVDGELDGVAVLTCQRCMGACEFELHEPFKVLLVQDEAELELEPGGYEAVLADPARLDLQALAEDQALLALPLVPKHASDTCGEPGRSITAVTGQPPAEDSATQRPFGNLRDLMQKKR